MMRHEHHFPVGITVTNASNTGARATGHEATRGTEPDRQAGPFAHSRARRLAKRPESTVRRWRTFRLLGHGVAIYLHQA